MKVLVYGCNGALGAAIVRCMRSKSAWSTVGVDVARSTAVHHSICVNPADAMFPSKSAPAVQRALEVALADNADKKLDAIICVSGGFAMGDAAAPQLLQGVEDMFARSVFPSFVCAQLASIYLRKGGLLLLPGAAVGDNTPTPWGLSYGASKGAVHHLVRSLAHPDSNLPQDVKVVGIAPITLDSDANRAAMPDADTSTWTPLSEVATTVCEWVENPSLCTSGVVYKVQTNSGKTFFVPME
mmetsp:Transcript_21185/g.31050  ORF Transcript_21185/g.31050 Transcript_21185/m.31050 type:complete len:241 (-) Transcript_21185:192-914(-)